MSFTVTSPINTYNCNDKIKKQILPVKLLYQLPQIYWSLKNNIYYGILYVVEEEYFLMHAFISDKVSTCFLPK